MKQEILNEASKCLRDIRGVLREVGPELQSAGVQAELEYIEPDVNSEEYEVSIWLRAEGTVLDVIEFFIVRQGKMVASCDDLLSWTRKELHQVAADRRRAETKTEILYKEGDSVRVIPSAPLEFRPGMGGSVCGSRFLEKETDVQRRLEPKGVRMYLIEFGDGYTMEIPDRYLLPLE